MLKKLSGDVVLLVPKKNDIPLLIHDDPHEGETLDYIVMPMRV